MEPANNETAEQKKETLCQHILITGKNKGSVCGSKIVCTVNSLCNKHNKARIAKNYEKYNNYGNPDQAQLWVNWINSVNDKDKL